MTRLAEVIERLERFDASGALAAALREWAIAPAPELEPVVVDLARLARDPIDPIARTRELKAHQAWLTVAARKEPSQLSWLLEAFLVEPISLYRGARRAQSLEKLTALCAFPPDPRLARLADAQLDSGLAREAPVALQLAALLISSGHANARSTLRVHATNQRSLRKAFEPLIASAQDRAEKPCSAEEVSRVAVLIAQNGARTAPERRSLESLFAAVYAHPDHDAPRQVLADALIEADDVRGEYLSLVFDPKKASAARKLLGRLRGGWLAPWRDFVAVEAVEFERGFPSSAMFIDSPLVDRSMGTLRSVIVSCSEAHFLTRDELGGVREVEVQARLLGEALRRHEKPLPWRVLKLSSGDDASAAAVMRELRSGKVPSLERLVLDGLGEAAQTLAVEFVTAFRGLLDLGFSSAKTCGAVVGAALSSKATLAFACREASLRGSVTSGVLSLRVASSAPAGPQKQFVSALPATFERLEFEMTGLGAEAVSELPAPFDALLRRAGSVG